MVDRNRDFNYIGSTSSKSADLSESKQLSSWKSLMTNIGIGIEQTFLLCYKHVMQKLSRSTSDLVVEFGLSIFLLLITLFLIGVDLSGGQFGIALYFNSLAHLLTYFFTQDMLIMT